MKNIISAIILIMAITSFAYNEAQSAIKIRIQWEAAWYFVCLFGSGTICSIEIDIPLGLSKTEAEEILGVSIPENGKPAVIRPIGEELGQSPIAMPERIVHPNDPSIVILDENFPNTATFPAQNVVYFLKYGGYIAYYFD